MLYLAAVLHTGCLQCALFGCSTSHRIFAVCSFWLQSFTQDVCSVDSLLFLAAVLHTGYLQCAFLGCIRFTQDVQSVDTLFFLVSVVHTGCFAVIFLSCSRSHTLLALHCGQSLLSFVALSHSHTRCFSVHHRTLSLLSCVTVSHTQGACPFIIRLEQCFRFPVTLSQHSVLLRAI